MHFSKVVVNALIACCFLAMTSYAEDKIYFYELENIKSISESLRTNKKIYNHCKNIVFFLFLNAHDGEEISTLFMPEVKESEKFLKWLKNYQNGDDQLLFDLDIKLFLMKDILNELGNHRPVLVGYNDKFVNIIGYNTLNKTLIVLDSELAIKEYQPHEFWGNTCIVRSPTSYNKAYFSQEGFYSCNLL